MRESALSMHGWATLRRVTVRRSGHQLGGSHAVDRVLPGAHDEELAKSRVAIFLHDSRCGKGCLHEAVGGRCRASGSVMAGS